MYRYQVQVVWPRSTPKCKPYIVSIFVVSHPVVLSKNSNMSVISVVKTLVHIWYTLAHIEHSSWIDRQYQPCESERRNWFKCLKVSLNRIKLQVLVSLWTWRFESSSGHHLNPINMSNTLICMHLWFAGYVEYTMKILSFLSWLLTNRTGEKRIK